MKTYAVKFEYPDGSTFCFNRKAESAEKAAAQIIAENPGSTLVSVELA